MSQVPLLLPTCVVCHKSSLIQVDGRAYAAWRAGAHIQHAFHDMSPDDRELLVTGTHPACWDTLTEGDDA